MPGRLVRGAWQDPESLRAILAREKIKTIVTLTAINQNDPKYPGQAKVVSEAGVSWVIVPMRGSTATLDQMARAADLLADPNRQPVFFHCVAGHHRTSLAHAAYLIRHQGYSAEQAWSTVASLPWSRPGAPADRNDKALIEEFARVQQSLRPQASKAAREVHDDEEGTIASARRVDHLDHRGDCRWLPGVSGLGSGELQLRRGPAGPDLSLRPDAGKGAGAGPQGQSHQDRIEPERI
jgi:protein tyrosine phosphatase (PTP) superfamily phosphohydrolase (DUF442 family)